MKSNANVTVTIKTRVEKFEGDDQSRPPVEVVEKEAVVPLASLPQEVQQQLMENRDGGTD